MKKIAFALIASLGLSASAFAALPPLGESLNEYSAIIDAVGTDSDFDETEFVVDIKRLTRRIDILGTVRYLITTKNVQEESNGCSCSREHRTHHYIAILEVSPNSGIGPNIVEVISIEPTHHHH